MGLTLIEAAKHETRVERLAVIRTFSEGQLIRRLPFRNLGLPIFRGQVDRRHAIPLRLSSDDQPNQNQAPVHSAAEAGGC